MRFLLATGALLVLASHPARAETIHLICFGGGTANKVTTSSAYASDSAGNSANVQAYGRREVGFDDQVNVEVNDDDTGRIRVPRKMLPPIRGGDGGWFELKKIKRTDREITGSAAINFINSPKVRLDRVTGTINISGKAGDYVGRCEPYDPAATQRKF